MKKIIKVFVLAFVLSLLGTGTLFAAGPASINLGTSGNFVILSKTGVSTTGATSVVGDIGVSPAQASYITGFGLILPADGAYSTSSLITGKVYAPSYANPTPSVVSTAVSDMETAYTDGAGRSLDAITEFGSGNIGGLTLAPGLYKWGTGVTIPTDVTLTGGANDVWIFVIAQNLDIASGKSIVLNGGAQASNVFFVVAGQTTIGTGATFNGNILDQTAIVLNTGAVLNGRALAQTAVTLDANKVTITTSQSNSNSNSNSNNSNNNQTVNTNSNNSNNPSADTMYANTVNPNSTPVIDRGCSNGNIYNTSTGVKCVNNEIIQNGCGYGNVFSTVTGAQCLNIAKYNFGDTTLKFGSKSEAVKELQRFLNAKLNLGLVVDGALGPKTVSVIKQWQKTNGLTSDGLVGTKTKIMMNL